MEREDTFEKWKVKWNHRYGYAEVIDLEKRRSVFFQGDEADEVLDQIERRTTPKFLDWFYDMGYDDAIDHPNYKLDRWDKEQLERWKGKEARRKARQQKRK